MKVALLAPIDSSIYSRRLLQMLMVEPNIKVCAVIVRSTLSFNRIRSEYRRDGVRLLRKIREKLLIPKQPSLTTDSLAGLKEICHKFMIPNRVVPDHNHPRAEEILKSSQPDLILFTGGGMIRKVILDIPVIGVLNCHSGILPSYRGMDVVEWALLDGLTNHVGLTLHLMDSGVDTGPILFTRHVPLQYQEKLSALRKRMESMMPNLMLEAVRGIQLGKFQPITQIPAQGKQYFVMHPRLKSRIKN